MLRFPFLTKKGQIYEIYPFRTACGIRTRDPQTENLMSWTTRRMRRYFRIAKVKIFSLRLLKFFIFITN